MSPEKNRVEELLDVIQKWGVTAAVVGTILLTFLYLVLDTQFGDPTRSVWMSLRDLTLSVIANVIPVLVAVVGSFFLFRRVERITESYRTDRMIEQISSRLLTRIGAGRMTESPAEWYEEFNNVPWSELLGGSKNLDVCVHWFDYWLEQNLMALQSFIDNGGTMRFVLPDPTNAALIRVIKQRFPEASERDIETKIRKTETVIRALVRDSGRVDAQAEIAYSNQMINYCGMRFDKWKLVISPFEHDRKFRVAAPAVVVELAASPSTGSWFDKEFRRLFQAPVRITKQS